MFGTNNNKENNRKNKGDERISKILDSFKVNYTLDDFENFNFEFELENKRTQLGFIRSQTYDFLGVELRDIFSVGLKSQGVFDARTANILLKENSDKKIGAWNVIADDTGHHLAIFTAKVSANLDADLLMGVVMEVLKTADEMEIRLSSGDDF